MKTGPMRLVVTTMTLVGAIALAGASAQAAAPETGIADPLAYVRQSYGIGALAAPPTAADDRPESANSDYTPRLRALFADDERYADGGVGRLDFSYIDNAQDTDLRDVSVTAEDVEGAPDRRVVTARFWNFRPVTSRFYFERTGGRWYLDDVSSVGEGKDDHPWTLSLILKYGY